jgi:peptidoglycan hydrolase-like protein with peptidoglycan-binding domain
MRLSLLTSLFGAGLLVLTGCSTTAVSGAAVSDPASTSQAPVAADPTSTAESTTTTTIPATTTTTIPATTTTTTTAPPTTMPTTIIEVAPLNPPLQAIGTRSGPGAERLQERLLATGFWVQSVDGSYGLTTRQAVMAVQKYAGLPADGVLNQDTATMLSAMTERARGRADAGTLVEVDKTRQLLFFVIDGVTEWVINTSTGTEVAYEKPNKNNPEIIERGSSITPTGLHTVNRQRPDGWWEGDLGEIYRPKYFIGGVAVHGSNSIPNYPASHGCVRVSVPAMDWIWESNLMPMDSPVWVHGSIPT